MTQVLN